MLVYTLEAQTPLAKRYELANDELSVTPYPMVGEFSSSFTEISSIDDFYELIQSNIQNPYTCLLKGQLIKELHNESRSGSTSPSTPTQWLCLDFDYVGIKSESQLDELLAQLGLGNVSYVLQYGSGHGIDKKFSAHVYMLLDAEVQPKQLKTWLMHKNLTVGTLCEAITLQKTDVALRWPLDVTLAQNDKLIYTAPPKCSGFKAPAVPRAKLVKRDNERASAASEIEAVTPGPVDAHINKRLNELRAAKGLPSKKLRTKTMGNLEVATNPDPVAVTTVKNERGFTYLNLNGGDSWGYYFPQENPDIVYNFKGEPNYFLKDLDRDFYYEYKKTLKVAQEGPSKAQPFAFLDRKTDQYFRGIFTPDTEQVEIYSTNSLKKLQDFAAQNNFFLGEYVEEWDYDFRFDSDLVFSREHKFINRYQRTPYMNRSLDGEDIPHKIPDTISKVLYSVVGDDADALMHFLNWLGYIVQTRQRAQTAWVFNGREGTGKGVLFNYIISPILGPQYCKTIRLASLEEDFSNGYLEDCVMLMIDESKTSQIKNYEKVMAMLKNLIVEPRISIRRMRTDAYMAQNFVNVIVTSNYPDAMYISSTDRRFNVGVYQSDKLHLTSADIKRIGEELWDFAKILRCMNIDEAKAMTPLVNEARERMMYLTETSITVAAKALLHGNLEFFIDCLPSDEAGFGSPGNVASSIMLDKYVKTLREAEASLANGGKMRVTRDQAQTLMEFAIGDIPKTANKFASFMKHYGIFFKRMRKGEQTPSCMETEWKPSAFTVDDCLGTGTNKVRAVK